ncbi:hypothetical protein IJU97_02920 [bacterium]|nr:hypothetical protein [bacterium]
MIKKLFGDNAEVKNLNELKNYIKKEIIKQKEEHSLVHTVEDYLAEIRKA